MKLVLGRNSDIFKITLVLAGIYGVFWGFTVIFFPKFWFNFANLPLPNYPELFQTIGLYEFSLGIAYILAAKNPIRNWQIVLVGFIIKLFMTIGFFYFYLLKNEPVVIFRMIFMNDIIWLIPFALIIYNAYKHEELLDNELIYLQQRADENFLEFYISNKGNNIHELSYQQPVLLVFLRHFGCTFCKDTLTKIQALKNYFSSQGIKLVLVNMIPENEAQKHLEEYNLADVDYVADVESMLYKAFQLHRGKFSQLFGLKVLVKGIYLWITKGAIISSSEGADVFQMPGIFLIKNGKVEKQFLYDSVADEPPLLDFANAMKVSTTKYC